jgi:hypothetical protein
MIGLGVIGIAIMFCIFMVAIYLKKKRMESLADNHKLSSYNTGFEQ